MSTTHYNRVTATPDANAKRNDFNSYFPCRRAGGKIERLLYRSNLASVTGNYASLSNQGTVSEGKGSHSMPGNGCSVGGGGCGCGNDQNCTVIDCAGAATAGGASGGSGAAGSGSGGIRLHDIFTHQNSLEELYGHSSSVDPGSPTSIYEKTEMEHRKNRPSNFQKHHSKSNITKYRKFSKVPSKHFERGNNNYGESKRGMTDHRPRVDICYRCLETRLRQRHEHDDDEDGDTILSQEVAKLQRKAYDVFVKTGSRARTPGDVINVVSYLHKLEGFREEDEYRDERINPNDRFNQVNKSVNRSFKKYSHSTSNGLKKSSGRGHKAIVRNPSVNNKHHIADSWKYPHHTCSFEEREESGADEMSATGVSERKVTKGVNMKERKASSKRTRSTNRVEALRRDSVKAWLAKRGHPPPPPPSSSFGTEDQQGEGGFMKSAEAAHLKSFFLNLAKAGNGNKRSSSSNKEGDSKRRRKSLH